MNPKLLELLTLVQEQMVLGYEIAQQQALNYRSDARYEISKHRRDEHGRSWDGEGAARHQQHYESELHALRKKYHLNQMKIDELIGELSTANV